MSVGVTLPAWSDVQITPSVALSTLYVDNFDLAPPGAPKSGELIGEIDPSVQLRQQAPEFVSALDYTLQALWFNHHSNLDTTHSNGKANVSWIPVANVFSVDGWASYEQQPIDPTQPTNEGNVFAVGNIANRLTAYIAPTLRDDFGGYSGMLRYSEATSQYSGVSGASGTLFQNSRTGTATGQLGSNDKQEFFTWTLDGHHSLTTFQSAQAFRDDRVSAEAGVLALPSLRLLAEVGAESNILRDTSAGGLNSGFWMAGFQWSPGAHNSLDLRAGHRFFGYAYAGTWNLSSRLLNFQVTYSEEPTTDAETDSLLTVVPGEIGVDTQAYFGVLRAINTYSPYLRKSLDASLALTGRQTQLTVRLYDLRRRYLQIPVQGGSDGDSTWGGELIATRELTPRDTVSLSGRLAHADELDGFRYVDHRYALDYIHKLTQTLDGSVEAVHLERDGSTRYQTNVFRLTLRKTF